MTTRYFSDGSPIEVPNDTTVTDTFTIGSTGFASNPSGTAEYQVIGRQVQMTIPALSGTSTSTSFTLTGLPAAVTPSSAKNVPAVQLTNGGLAVLGSATVNTNGTITLSAGLLGTLFSALFGKGIAKQEISWLI